ncbi:MAG: ribosome assembly RNA-binding protein YhbY [Bacillota bacterium]|jgi:RNA-binding protein|nr:ribosome assembly RNA-binding protein YhbY [Bacillota bacterium]HHU43594.1 ribosome assembly RNA-binding protein YhbY [Clostridiales bacterium]
MDSKERSRLSSLAQTVKPVFQIGKNGINDIVLKEIEDVLEARELIKINVLKTAPKEPKEFLEELCKELNAEQVNCVGQKIVLYRKSKRNKKKN